MIWEDLFLFLRRFQNCKKKVIWISFAKDTGGLTSSHVNIYQLPRVNLLLKVPLLATFENRCPAYFVLFRVLEYGSVVNTNLSARLNGVSCDYCWRHMGFWHTEVGFSLQIGGVVVPRDTKKYLLISLVLVWYHHWAKWTGIPHDWWGIPQAIALEGYMR